jgi:hypothetical protein
MPREEVLLDIRLERQDVMKLAVGRLSPFYGSAETTSPHAPYISITYYGPLACRPVTS